MKRPRTVEWARLDNASKIFPATWSVKDPKVFRIACELYEEVEPTLLQEALERTVEDYPLYTSVLRRGMFWYYLESSDLRPEVQPETTTICAPIYVGLRNSLLFRVSYYKCRVNLEVFHALSDGTGALCFLQDMMYHYVTRRHREQFPETIPVTGNAPISGQMADGFSKHFAGGSQKNPDKQKRGNQRAYQIHGTAHADNRLNLIEAALSAEAVLEKAHQYNATMTVYLTSAYLYAISKEMAASRKNQPVVLTVPVNLRQYFESDTARNFFSYFYVGYRFDKESADLPAIIRSVGESFRDNMTVEQLSSQSNKFMSIEKNFFARIVPLPIKDFVTRIAVNSIGTETTSTISNIGRIAMPKELTPFIRQFSVCTSVNRPQMTLCSFGDRLVLSIASPFRETDIQRTFIRLLSESGLDVELSSNISMKG